MTKSAAASSKQRGMVLLAVLVFILVTTLAASSMVVVHQTQMQREKETELLFVGEQFRKAISSYYNTIPPGGLRALPNSLEALLADQRFAKPIQHLRRIYPDPMTGRADWQPVLDGSGIIGVKSASGQQPLKRKNFPKGFEAFEDKESYADWVFAVRR